MKFKIGQWLKLKDGSGQEYQVTGKGDGRHVRVRTRGGGKTSFLESELEDARGCSSPEEIVDLMAGG